jgi:hypothetical protein
MHAMASSRLTRETRSMLAGSSWMPHAPRVSDSVQAAPARLPRVPPIEMIPKRRAACSSSKASAIRPQKTETTNRLKTLSQT